MNRFYLTQPPPKVTVVLYANRNVFSSSENAN